jgi:[FeFe] hydrogenase H-cluster maturation GTPase HydF
MKKSPKSLRLHIGIFGRTNTGKSTFLNYVTRQNTAITSSIPGTTTDVVEKTMELLPVGPVVFLDTAGIDDISPLSNLRVEKTRKTFRRVDVFLLLTEPDIWGEYEEKIYLAAKENKAALIVVINKIDIKSPSLEFIDKIKEFTPYIILCSCINNENRDKTISELKKNLLDTCPEDFINPPPLVGDLIPKGKVSLLIIPLDLQAPKGRLILPQVQVLRDILDNNRSAMIIKEDKIKEAVSHLKELPAIGICDSQVVFKMVSDLPPKVKCTTFSILFARYKGDLKELVKGAKQIDALKPEDKILISESCSHHPIADDIGRVKIPQWLKKYKGFDIPFDIFSGRDYPDDLEKYKLVIHCGGCMLTRREMLNRIRQAKEKNVPITNYGVTISLLQGVLKRVLSPFPEEEALLDN